MVPGDRVAAAFRQGWIDGPDSASNGARDLGGALDGMLGDWAVLNQEGVVKIPESMSYQEAACFPCAGVTAWNALMTRPIRVGETVLIQGSGGVSLFALQIAHAAGARVIATTSSAEKAERLRALGVDEVINYRQTPECGDAVRALTGGGGADRVVEVGGAGTLARSMRATRRDGHILLVGLLDRSASWIDPMELISEVLTISGIQVGNRAMLEAALAAYAVKSLKPVVDRSFPSKKPRQLSGISLGSIILARW